MSIWAPADPGFPPAAVLRLLEVPLSTRQVRVFVVADNKQEACEAMEASGFPMDPLHRPELHLATGNDLSALHLAGLLDEPTILVVHDLGGTSPVVACKWAVASVVGYLDYGESWHRVFRPVEAR